MMKNNKIAHALDGDGRDALTSMLKYKTAREGKGYIGVNRFFASSKTCSWCLHAKAKMPLEIGMWTCDQCGTMHNRDQNAAINIRNEAKRMVAAGAVAAPNGGTISRKTGRNYSITLVPLKSEAPSFTAG